MSEYSEHDKRVDLAASHATQRRVLVIVFLINLSTFLLMAVTAWYSSSSSLLSGSLDNLGDALTYALSLAVVASSLRTKAYATLVKGLLILVAAVAVAVQIIWRLTHPAIPLFESMSIVGIVNLVANIICLRLLSAHRRGDINMTSAWESSLNDIFEGSAVLLAALAVWLLDASWPDLVIAVVLLFLFLGSAIRVLRSALMALKKPHQHPPLP